MERPFKDERYRKVVRIVSMVDTFGFNSSVVCLETEPSKLDEIVSRFRIVQAARLERLKNLRYEQPEDFKQLAADWVRPEDGWDHIYSLVNEMEQEAAAKKYLRLKQTSLRLKKKSLRFNSIALVFILLFSVSLSLSSYMHALTSSH